jgi:cell division protein ZapA (FtsZ GTPase activity inhibitor)
MIHFMSRQIPRRVFSGTISELTEERMRLQERTREVKAETQLAMLEAPLTYLELVDKGDRIEQERRYFQHKAMQLQQSIAKMRRMIAELLRTEP